jgi:hypothetical protein
MPENKFIYTSKISLVVEEMNPIEDGKTWVKKSKIPNENVSVIMTAIDTVSYALKKCMNKRCKITYPLHKPW